MKYVKVMTVPGKGVDVQVADDATVGTAVQAANMTTDGFSITLSPFVEGANANTNVADGSTIVLTRAVKGA